MSWLIGPKLFHLKLTRIAYLLSFASFVVIYWFQVWFSNQNLRQLYWQDTRPAGGTSATCSDFRPKSLSLWRKMQTSDATSQSPKVRPLIWHLTVQGSKPPLYFLLLSALCSQSQLSFCCHCCFHSCCHSTLCKAQTFILKPWTAPRMLCKESFQRKRLSGGGKAKHSGRISRVHNAESRTRVPFKIASTLSTMLDSSLNTVSPSSPALLVSEWQSSVGQRRFWVDTKSTFEHFVTEVTLNFPALLFWARTKSLKCVFLKESYFNETTRPLPDAFNSKSERIDLIA